MCKSYHAPAHGKQGPLTRPPPARQGSTLKRASACPPARSACGRCHEAVSAPLPVLETPWLFHPPSLAVGRHNVFTQKNPPPGGRRTPPAPPPPPPTPTPR